VVARGDGPRQTLGQDLAGRGPKTRSHPPPRTSTARHLRCYRDALRTYRLPRRAPSAEAYLWPRRAATPVCAAPNVATQQRVIERSSPFTYPPAFALRTCSAEDLVVLKAFADRPKDWLDIEGVVVRQSQLDWSIVRDELAPLAALKEAPDLGPRLERLRERLAE
jgi:hypothetical protein